MQYRLDFTGKKDERITIAASSDLKDALEKLTKALNRPSISELAHEYIIECVWRDVAKIEKARARGDRFFLDMD